MYPRSNFKASAVLDSEQLLKLTKLCQLTIRFPNRPSLQVNTTAYALAQIAGILPYCLIPQQLLDLKFYESAQIDILDEADVFPSDLFGGTRPNIFGSLLGQEPIFGWILTGPVLQGKIGIPPIPRDFPTRLYKLLTKFWEMEDLPVKVVKASDLTCEESFLRSFQILRTEQRLRRDRSENQRESHMREVLPEAIPGDSSRATSFAITCTYES